MENNVDITYQVMGREKKLTQNMIHENSSRIIYIYICIYIYMYIYIYNIYIYIYTYIYIYIDYLIQ